MDKLYNSRTLAILILSEILHKNHSRDYVIERYFTTNNISDADKNLTFNIVMNTLRFKEVLDEIVGKVLNIKIQMIEPLIQASIEIALAQILTMDKIPIYAAVSESIEGYKQISKNPKGVGFLNFALRKISKKTNIKDLFERYKISNSLINSLTHDLNRELASDELQNIYKYSFERLPIFLRIRKKYNIKENIIPILEREKIDYRLSRITPLSIILPDNVSITLLNKILPENSFIIQSELSQVAAYLLAIEKGDKLLDVCSGNQIKIEQISEMLDNQINITSIDIKDIKNPKFNFIKADAQNIKLANQFNKILIDAPCSGLGTLSQNPEIKFRINYSAIKRFAYIQYKILKNISQYLEPQGRLLYSVCTITKSETKELIKKFLEENTQFEIIKPVTENNELNRFLTDEGFLRIVNYNNQSFFYAILSRK